MPHVYPLTALEVGSLRRTLRAEVRCGQERPAPEVLVENTFSCRFQLLEARASPDA